MMKEKHPVVIKLYIKFEKMIIKDGIFSLLKSIRDNNENLQ
jgi:hypothetical protein